jgi:hypothetical protein
MFLLKQKRFDSFSRLVIVGLVVLVTAALLFSGCGQQPAQKLNDNLNPTPANESPVPAPEAQVPEATVPNQNQQPDISAKPAQTTTSVTLYFGDQQAEFLLSQVREITKGNETLESAIIAELIKGPQNLGQSRTIPEGTKLLSVSVVNGVAYVNFSKELQTKHWGGSAGETMTVYSVVNTLGTLPGIQKVQFLIEGDKQESIFGHMDTSIPISPDWNLSSKKDSGRYVGQIDNNSIEIKISGVPDTIAAKAFRLSEEVKVKFNNYGLKTGDQIRFTYSLNEHGQGVITEITKL